MTSKFGPAISISESESDLRRKLQTLQLEAMARMRDSRVVTAGDTILETDRGTVLRFSDGVDGTITLPIDLPEDWRCEMLQLGAGRPTIAPALGANVNALGGTARIVGQYGRVVIEVVSNTTGVAASAVVSGDVG